MASRSDHLADGGERLLHRNAAVRDMSAYWADILDPIVLLHARANLPGEQPASAQNTNYILRMVRGLGRRVSAHASNRDSNQAWDDSTRSTGNCARRECRIASHIYLRFIRQ